MKTFRAIYYGEVFLNLGSAVLAIFAPALFLSQFTPAPQSDVAVEMMRWFGGLMVVLTWVGWRILRGGDNRALSWMLEGFLVGDIVHLFILLQFLRVIGGFPFSAIFDILATVSLGISRALFLWMTRKSGPLDIWK